MQHHGGITPATPTFADLARAAPGWELRGGQAALRQVEAAVQERHTAETTGSLAGPCDRAPIIHDGHGRDLRSRTRGNAKSPERRPIQQNLGATTGGPEF